MTVTDVAPSWTLSELARGQLSACGIALSEVYRVLRKPQLMMPSPEGGMKYTGYGLVVVVSDGTQITFIAIDGATTDNWQDWAVERAVFGDSDVAAADALVRAELPAPAAAQMPVQPRRKVPAASAPVQVTHVLDAIHPSLRAEITRQVAGDFSRLVVHSSVNVSILPIE